MDLESFKALYAKIKYCTFDSVQDYTTVIDSLKKLSKRLHNDHGKELINLDGSDEEMSEFTDLEKLGQDGTFDHRVGNRYTRKVYIRDVYNTYYLEKNPTKQGMSNSKPKHMEENKKSIRSQDFGEGTFLILVYYP